MKSKCRHACIKLHVIRFMSHNLRRLMVIRLFAYPTADCRRLHTKSEGMTERVAKTSIAEAALRRADGGRKKYACLETRNLHLG